MSFLRKAIIQEEASGQQLTASPCEVTENLPAVWEYLTSARYPDGSPRTTSALTLFVQDGEVKAVLSDKDAGLSLWSSGRSVSEALAVMDEQLQSETPRWRRSGGSAAQKGKKGR